MKYALYLVLFFPVLAWAQPRYGVEGIPMCWTISGKDSSITRYALIASTGKPVKTIAFENAAGQVINVSGGYLKYGYCDCGGSGTGGNGIYGGSGVLPNDTVQVQNTKGLKFEQPGSSNGMLIMNSSKGALGFQLDPILTDSIRQGLFWKMGADSAAVGIDKDGKLQLISDGWVTIGNAQAKLFVRQDDAGIGFKFGNIIYYLADNWSNSPNQIMVWDNNPVGRFEPLALKVKRDTSIYFEGHYDMSAAIGYDKIRRNYRKIALNGVINPGTKVNLRLPDGGDEMSDLEVTVRAANDTIVVFATTNDQIRPSTRNVYPTQVNKYECVFAGGTSTWMGSVWDTINNIYQGNGKLNSPRILDANGYSFSILNVPIFSLDGGRLNYSDGQIYSRKVDRLILGLEAIIMVILLQMGFTFPTPFIGQLVGNHTDFLV
jgi:hypothetical protein